MDTLLSTDLHLSFHQTLTFALWLFVMVENCQVKLSLPEDNQPFLKTSQQKTIFHVVQCVLWRFNWILRDQSKLSYRFYWYKISISIDLLLLLGTFFSCSLFILGHSPGIEQSRVIYFHTWNTLIKLMLLRITPPPDPNRGIKPAISIHFTMNPSYVRSHLHYFFQIS